MKNCFIYLLPLAFCHSASAQDLPTGFKNWFSLGTDLEVNKKLDIEISELNCFNTGPMVLQFTQLSLGASYKLGKRTYLLSGIEQFHFRSGSNYNLYHKASAGLLLRKLARLPIKQSLEAEWFFPRQKKHRLRGIYTVSYSLKNDFLPLHGRPFIKGQVYYYLGGAPLTYYDGNGDQIAYQSPNDLHRYRLTGGLSLRPIKYLTLAIYYVWNKEFNTGLFDKRALNIPSKDGTRTKYAFNDYSVLGASLTYQLKLD